MLGCDRLAVEAHGVDFGMDDDEEGGGEAVLRASDSVDGEEHEKHNGPWEGGLDRESDESADQLFGVGPVRL